MPEDLFDSWRDDAACDEKASWDPDWSNAWIAEDHLKKRQAIEICKNFCPVQFECLSGAVGNTESQGIRGGFDFDRGRVTVRDARQIERDYGLRASSLQQGQEWR